MVVGVDAELDESSVDDITQTEEVIVSQWREVTADEKHQMREQIDEILRSLGFKIELLVLSRANSVALYFLCMTLSAVTGLRDQWSSGQLEDTVQSLFTFLSRATRQVRVKRLNWPLNDYEQCLEVFRSLPGRPTVSKGYNRNSLVASL